jgi:peroxiredoxin
VATRPTSGLEEASVIQAGDKAPSIAGTTFDGRVIDLGAPGKPTVLYFYPKASTPG